MDQNDKRRPADQGAKKDEQTPKERAGQKRPVGQPTGAMSPGDQAPPGTPGTGENICPVCAGKGAVAGRECANCAGTGVVIEAIGGA